MNRLWIGYAVVWVIFPLCYVVSVVKKIVYVGLHFFWVVFGFWLFQVV